MIGEATANGHPDNTRTPLIAWGSGVAKPIVTKGSIALGHDELSSDWGLDHIQRHDVAQADIAALMAYLAGLEFPVNSVGELPLSYLSTNLAEKSVAALVNCRGILEMYRVKEEQKKARELRYRPYKPLGDEEHSVERRLSIIGSHIDEGRYTEAIAESDALIKIGLQGLRYLQTYDWLFLRALVTMGLLGVDYICDYNCDRPSCSSRQDRNFEDFRWQYFLLFCNLYSLRFFHCIKISADLLRLCSFSGCFLGGGFCSTESAGGRSKGSTPPNQFDRRFHCLSREIGYISLSRRVNL